MANAIKRGLKARFDEEELHPFLDDDISYGKGFAHQGLYIYIPANTTDQVVDLSNRGTFEDSVLVVDPEVKSSIGKISIKVNNSTQSFKVNPSMELSEDISQILVSNSDTTNTHQLEIYPITIN